jgi:hypothetical protein
MLVRQSVKVKVSISATTVNFREQLPNALLQDLIPPFRSLRVLTRIDGCSIGCGQFKWYA